MREYKFLTEISTVPAPSSETPPTADNDLVERKFLLGYRTLDLASSADGVSGQILGDRPYLIISANTGSIKFKGLIFQGLPEITIINTLESNIEIDPAPSSPEHGFTDPPDTIPAGKAYKFIRDFTDNRWVAMGGGEGSGILSVASKTERDDIPEAARQIGMLVFINDGDFQIQTTYQLVGGITNSHWQIVGGGNNSTMTLSGFGGPVYETNHNVLMSPESDNTGAVIEAGMPIGKELSFLRIYESSFTCTISLSGSETFLNGDTSYTLPGSGDYLKMKKITSTLWGKFS